VVVEDVDEFFPLFLHSFLIVLTPINVERLLNLGLSSSVIESAEKRLAAVEEVLRL
jgi:hypothetical protein